MIPKPVKKHHHKITQEEAIRLLKERQEMGLPLVGEQIRKENFPLYRVVIKTWGQWIKALEILGFPNSYNRRWTKEKLIAVLKDRLKEGKSFTYTELVKEDSGLIFQIYKHFGSQNNVLKTLGISPSRNLSKEEVLEKMKMQAKMPDGLSIRELKKAKIYYAINRHFGSRFNALKAIGLTEAAIARINSLSTPTKWNPEKILTAIDELKRHNRDLEGIKIFQTNPSLYKAAINYFGSWRAAAQQANDKDSKPHEEKEYSHWTRRRILKCLSELLKQYGDPSSIPESEKKGIEQPCRVHFGSLKKGFLQAHQERKKKWLKTIYS
ncbi:MAG: hypothetical protein HY202_09050 [Nitrospirae bacterium]|nr:hypothetical protein [Nitrospirota bacterium]